MEHFLQEPEPNEQECPNCLFVLKAMIVIVLVMLVGMAWAKHSGTLPVPPTTEEIPS